MLRGSHGTCKSFARSIESDDRFDPSKHGRIGKGSYFWLHSDSKTGEELGRSLARVWFLSCSKGGTYKDAKERECAVIFVSLDLKEDCYLDFDDPDVSTDYDQFFLEGKNRYSNLSEEDQSKIRDAFVFLIEEQFDIEFDAVLGVVDVPQGNFVDDGEPANKKRRSKCAAVRNQAVINIRSIDLDYV